MRLPLITGLVLAGALASAPALAGDPSAAEAACKARFLVEKPQEAMRGMMSLAAPMGAVATTGAVASFAAPPSAVAAAPPPPAAKVQVQRMLAVNEAARAGGAPGIGVLPNDDANRDRYADVKPNPVRVAAEEPVSTFGADVDTASYSNVRRWISKDGRLPPGDSVRVEEVVNYLDYGYAPPADRAAPFATHVALYPTPWNRDTLLLHVGLKGYELPKGERPAANLVFLMDVSGSMHSIDRLPLAKTALCMLVHELGAKDRVALVTYAGSTGVALPPTAATERETILAALDKLEAGGSTAGGAGIELAYAEARKNFDANAVNRVVLATDGDFNVGITDPKQLEEYVARQRKSGVWLTVLGFGRGNYNDDMQQRLAQAGNGAAAYIDTVGEARKVLVNGVAGTLFPIAKDLKAQVEFNPAKVAEYRLIGYETRLLRREDFNNDAVDSGDIGAGHQVTALYEIVPVGSRATLVDGLRYAPKDKAKGGKAAGDASGEYAFVKLRYKRPDADASQLIERPVGDADRLASLDQAPADFRLAAAAAAFAQKLKGEAALAKYGYGEIAALVRGALGDDRYGYRAEFLDLVNKAGQLAR